jgi:sterol desaturase/sphingolipid hydroxylase (fatty acid hydroxylase superfamily)
MDARYNHGVTSPLWDLVFGTYRQAGTITVPRKFRMRWLVDAETGCIRHKFRDDFQLKGAQLRS